MCLSSPKVQAPAPVTPAAMSKTPDTPQMMAEKRKKQLGMSGGTLLTGPTGAAPAADQLSRTSLLGQ